MGAKRDWRKAERAFKLGQISQNEFAQEGIKAGEKGIFGRNSHSVKKHFGEKTW